MDWDEREGRVSRAFSDWRVVDRDQRAFLAFGLRMARETYSHVWRAAEHAPRDASGPDMVDLFDELWPREYESMHAASVLRDAVTNFEVYVEQAAAELLAGGGAAGVAGPAWAELVAGGGAAGVAGPAWADLAAVFDRLGVAIDSEEVRSARELRRRLTHDRAASGAAAARRERSGAGGSADGLELGEADVLAVMDRLAAAVRSIDAAVWARAAAASDPAPADGGISRAAT